MSSARTRLLLTFLSLLAASTVVSTLLLRQLLLERADERVESALTQEIEEFRTLARIGRDPRSGRAFQDAQAVFDVYLSRNVPNRGETWFTIVGDQPYRTTEPNSPLVDDVLRLGPVTEPRSGGLAEGVRYLAVPVGLRGERAGAFVAAADLDQERDEVDQAVRIAAGVSLTVLVGASLIAFLLAGRILAPLRDVTRTARAISETDLSRRIAASDSDDEVAELARTFNQMLDRIEAAFSSQRAFVSDASHELRTPITIIRGHLELLSDDPAERDDTIALVTDELDRMSRIVDDLLTLAKAGRGGFLRLEELDLDLLTEDLFAKSQALAPGRDWQLGRLGTGRLTADRHRLTQALMNLASNAAQHTRDGGRIELGSSLDGPGVVRLWVDDEGPGVPRADQERIFERFARGDRGTRRGGGDGAGLGLSIVRAIAEAHGGHVELDSIPGRGARFTVVIPQDPTPDPEVIPT